MLIYRAKSRDDVDRVSSLYPEYSNSGVFVGSSDYEYKEVAAGRRVIFSADSDGETIGTIQLLTVDDLTDDPMLMKSEFGHLQRLRVCEAFRRQGVGARLYVAAEAEARILGLKGLTLTITPDNLVALELYQRRGFVFMADIVSRSSGRPLIAMEKYLSI